MIGLQINFDVFIKLVLIMFAHLPMFLADELLTAQISFKVRGPNSLLQAIKIHAAITLQIRFLS